MVTALLSKDLPAAERAVVTAASAVAADSSLSAVGSPAEQADRNHSEVVAVADILPAVAVCNRLVVAVGRIEACRVAAVRRYSQRHTHGHDCTTFLHAHWLRYRRTP